MTEYPQAPPVPAEPPDSGISLQQMLVAESVRDKLITIANATPRSRQDALGGSEVGQKCRRRLAYRLTGTPVVNVRDPIKPTIIGGGGHMAIAEGLARIDPQRYMIEAPVIYRGIPGHVDCYDRFKRWVIDWKITGTKRLRRYRTEGVPANYVTQINIYAAGLIAAGFPVDLVAVVFIDRDGEVDDVYAWTAKPDQRIADEAINVLDQLRAELAAGRRAADIEPWTSPLCRYCPNYNPLASDLTLACPGEVMP